MSEEGIRGVICRLLTDEYFKKAYIKDPVNFLKKSGYNLSKKDIEDLARSDVERFKLVIKKFTVEGNDHHGVTVEPPKEK
jgi:spore germination protein YaaH